MTTDDKSREEFEKWYECHSLTRSSTKELYYKIWQAAIAYAASAPLVVVLPKKQESENGMSMDAYLMFKGWNDALIKIRSLNADKSIVWEEKK